MTHTLYRLKIPHPELHEWDSLASDGVEPSAAFAAFGRNLESGARKT